MDAAEAAGRYVCLYVELLISSERIRMQPARGPAAPRRVCSGWPSRYRAIAIPNREPVIPRDTRYAVTLYRVITRLAGLSLLSRAASAIGQISRAGTKVGRAGLICMIGDRFGYSIYSSHPACSLRHALPSRAHSNRLELYESLQFFASCGSSDAPTSDGNARRPELHTSRVIASQATPAGRGVRVSCWKRTI